MVLYKSQRRLWRCVNEVDDSSDIGGVKWRRWRRCTESFGMCQRRKTKANVEWRGRSLKEKDADDQLGLENTFLLVLSVYHLTRWQLEIIINGKCAASWLLYSDKWPKSNKLSKTHIFSFDNWNKAGYTAISCGRVGRGRNARFPTFQLDHHGPTDQPLIELRVRN